MLARVSHQAKTPQWTWALRRVTSVLLVGLLAFFAYPATGSTPPLALTRFEQGKAAFTAGKFAEALRDFEASNDIYASPHSRLYMARCYRAMGKLASAYTHFKLAARLAQEQSKITSDQRFEATSRAAIREAAALQPQVPLLTIVIPPGVPEGFIVRLDNAVIPRAAWGSPMETDAGAHDLIATGPRMKDMVRKFRLAAGEKKRVVLSPRDVPTAVITLSFRTRPGGLAVYIDDQPVRPEQFDSKHYLATGEHRIVVRAPGYTSVNWRRTLAEKEQVSVPVELKPSRGTPRWVFFTAAAATVAALGTGAGFLVHAQQLQDGQLAKDPLLRDPALKDQIRNESTTAKIVFAGGAALGVAAIVLAFTTHWKTESTRATPPATVMRLTPWLGTAGSGLTLDGSF